MTLLNCKVKLKPKWKKYCVLSAASNRSTNANLNNIIFTIKDKKLYVPVVALSPKDSKKLSKLLSKRFERSFYWNKYKTKIETKNTQYKYRYFPNQILLESLDYFL